jgi:hypothetical protein
MTGRGVRVDIVIVKTEPGVIEPLTNKVREEKKGIPRLIDAGRGVPTSM